MASSFGKGRENANRVHILAKKKEKSTTGEDLSFLSSPTVKVYS